MKRLGRVYNCRVCREAFVFRENVACHVSKTCSPACLVELPDKLKPLHPNNVPKSTAVAPILTNKELTEIKQKAEHFKKQKRKRKFKGSFYTSDEWLKLRYQALKKYGKTCMLCGEVKGPVHVDHIKPRSKYPQLALDFDNLQILCVKCNLGKSNTDETDFRPLQLEAGRPYNCPDN
jgi:5-methylcytosine-specific restriction endonuclease McrA